MANLLDFWFEPDTFSVKVNESYQPKIMGRFDDGTTQDITNNSTHLADPTVINNSGNFTVSKSGLVTGKYPGSSYVKAWGNVYTFLSATVGVSGSGYTSRGIAGSATQDGNLAGYPSSGAWDPGMVGSGHWAPANARTAGSMGGWMGYSFYSPTKVTEVQYEPHAEPIYGSLGSHYVTALIGGTWKTFYPSYAGNGVFGTRYKCTINDTATAIRIHISGYASSIPPQGPLISVLRPYVIGSTPGYQTTTKQALVKVTGFPNEIVIDPNGNPAGTEYFVQGSQKEDFSSPYTVANWTTQTTVSEDMPTEAGVRYYRVKARNSKGVETAWSNLGRVGLLPPENLRLVKAEGNNLTIAWDTDMGATEYELLRGGTVVYTGPATSYKDTGLTSNTSYTYTVRSKNGSMLSDQSLAKTFKTEIAGPDMVPSQSTINATYAFIRWNSQAIFPKGYHVYLDGVKVTTAPIVGNSPGYSFKGLTPEKKYRVSISGIDSSNVEYPGYDSEFTTQAFPKPNFDSRDNTKDYVKLAFSWPQLEYPEEYVITRDGVEIFRGASLLNYGDYKDTTVVFSSTYTYKLRAISGGVQSPEATFQIKVSDIAGMAFYSWNETAGTGSGIASSSLWLAGYTAGSYFYLNRGDIFNWPKDSIPRTSVLSDTDMYVMLDVQPGSAFANRVTAEDERLMMGNMYPLWTTPSDPASGVSGDFFPSENVLNKGRILRYKIANPQVHSWNQNGTYYAWDRVHISIPVAPYGTSQDPWANSKNVRFTAAMYVKLVAKTEAAKARLTAAETPWMCVKMRG